MLSDVINVKIVNGSSTTIHFITVTGVCILFTSHVDTLYINLEVIFFYSTRSNPNEKATSWLLMQLFTFKVDTWYLVRCTVKLSIMLQRYCFAGFMILSMLHVWMDNNFLSKNNRTRWNIPLVEGLQRKQSEINVDCFEWLSTWMFYGNCVQYAVLAETYIPTRDNVNKYG